MSPSRFVLMKRWKNTVCVINSAKIQHRRTENKNEWNFLGDLYFEKVEIIV